VTHLIPQEWNSQLYHCKYVVTMIHGITSRSPYINAHESEQLKFHVEAVDHLSAGSSESIWCTMRVCSCCHINPFTSAYLRWTSLQMQTGYAVVISSLQASCFQDNMGPQTHSQHQNVKFVVINCVHEMKLQ